MIYLNRIALLLCALLSLVQISIAASATSFCKCTCFSNSTIIQLDGKSKSSAKDAAGSGSGGGVSDGDSKKVRGTCNDCNRAFCLDYNLPICKGAKEEDVFTTCFQRDSAKDEAVVFIFIFATTGLLGYAAVKPWVEKWTESWRERRNYMPLANPGAEDR